MTVQELIDELLKVEDKSKEIIKGDMNNNRYDGRMDEECIPLCDALNSLPGVETTSSCCGHCNNDFMIFFNCNNSYSLAVIARAFNRRYSGTFLVWKIEVETHDNGSYDYFVHSVEAYENNTIMEKDISQLVENIKHWSSEKYKEHFINGVTSEEKKKLNLKLFSLQRAKEGKPVCTRGGRKARIIYFDAKGAYPIVALIETGNGEKVVQYMIDGHCTDIISHCCDDLMMLPEKKEGWVNVYKGGLLDSKAYDTRKEAFDKASPQDYVDTVKIFWEE